MIRFIVLVMMFLTLGSCATQGSFILVNPGQIFRGEYIEIQSPTSEGWKIVQSDATGMVFGRGDRSIGMSFIAYVVIFDLAPASTSLEFEMLIKSLIEADYDPVRFEAHDISLYYSDERAYPCVRYQARMIDKAPQWKNGPLLLEVSAIYCRHPVRKESGFGAVYSHRGQSLHPHFVDDANEFIQGVQVPDKRASLLEFMHDGAEK